MDINTDKLKKEVILPLFTDTSRIGSYGAECNADSINRISSIMESGSVTALSESITSIVHMLQDADPQVIQKKSNWLQRFLGQDVENRVKYTKARSDVESLLEIAAKNAERVHATIIEIDEILQTQQQSLVKLDMYIKAGYEFLSENPNAGVEAAGAMSFDKPRERFSRKLVNLAALLTSNELSISQMKLAKAQALDILDRFGEISQTLIPLWRHHSLAILTKQKVSAELMGEANKAHEALKNSLLKSLDGLN